MVGFFSQKVKEKVVRIRELLLKHSAEAHWKRGPADRSGLQTPTSFGLQNGVRHSLWQKVAYDDDMKTLNLEPFLKIFS